MGRLPFLALVVATLSPSLSGCGSPFSGNCKPVSHTVIGVEEQGKSLVVPADLLAAAAPQTDGQLCMQGRYGYGYGCTTQSVVHVELEPVGDPEDTRMEDAEGGGHNDQCGYQLRIPARIRIRSDDGSVAIDGPADLIGTRSRSTGSTEIFQFQGTADLSSFPARSYQDVGVYLPDDGDHLEIQGALGYTATNGTIGVSFYTNEKNITYVARFCTPASCMP